MKIQSFLMGLALLATPVQAQVKMAVFSLNDFHAGFVHNDNKLIPGAAAVLQTLDSLKAVYPTHITVSAGDNFGGSYFYNATHGQLLPVLFDQMGIRLSALGNHEFDDGQEALANKWQGTPGRPADWDMTYVCANVRNAKGEVPAFAQPVATVPVTFPNGKVLKTAFVGLIASSTPEQASKRKLKGLSFDGNYPAVLDSVLALPVGQEVRDADCRILLTHIGSRMNASGQPEWIDKDIPNLKKINSPLWHGILSSHSHNTVTGRINDAQYPIVQGLWHGQYIGMLVCDVDTTAMQVTHVEAQVVPVTPKKHLEAGPARLQQMIDRLLVETRGADGTPIGQKLTTSSHLMYHDREDKYKQTEVGTLVCKAYAEAYRHSAGLSDKTPIVGCSHFGSIRSGFPKGDITMLDVGEALPFSNSLRIYHLTGAELFKLVDYGFHNRRFGWIQTGNLDIERNDQGDVTRLTYVSPKGKRMAVKAKKMYYVVADDFMTTGGDGYLPELFPAKRLVEAKDMPSTTVAFISYLRRQKEI